MSKCENSDGCSPDILPFRVIIIEDNKFIRSGWELLLGKQTDFTLIGSYWSYEDAENHNRFCETDIVIMDIKLPGVSGIEGIRKIKESYPQVTIVVCTAYEENRKILEAISAGALGFINKQADEEEMLFFLRNAMKGISPMSPSIAREILLIYKEKQKTISSTLPTSWRLEKSILEKLADGKSYTTSAKELKMELNELMETIGGIYKTLHDKAIEINT